jgi:hypothetical protein
LKRKQNGDKTCLRDGQLKFIQNWQKQCCQCSHGCLVAVQVKDPAGQVIILEQAYLFDCPHINWLSRDFVPTPFTINLAKLDLARLKWQPVKGAYIDGLEILAQAEIPRNNWFEILALPVYLKLVRCPQCGF